MNQTRNWEKPHSCSVSFNPIRDLLTTMSSWATKAGVPGQLEAECCVQVYFGSNLKGRVFAAWETAWLGKPFIANLNYFRVIGQPLQHKLISLWKQEGVFIEIQKPARKNPGKREGKWYRWYYTVSPLKHFLHEISLKNKYKKETGNRQTDDTERKWGQGLRND